MNIQNISLSDIHPYARNPRKNDEAVKNVASNVIFAREWTRTCQVVWYGECASTYRVTARISFGTPLICLYENGRPLGQRDYSSPKRAMNAIREIVRCAGYAF